MKGEVTIEYDIFAMAQRRIAKARRCMESENKFCSRGTLGHLGSGTKVEERFETNCNACLPSGNQ